MPQSETLGGTAQDLARVARDETIMANRGTFSAMLPFGADGPGALAGGLV